MKCELCHQKDAETAIQLEKDGEEQELYVCRECANRERVRRQKKSQRTRKGADGLPPGVRARTGCRPACLFPFLASPLAMSRRRQSSPPL